MEAMNGTSKGHEVHINILICSIGCMDNWEDVMEWEKSKSCERIHIGCLNCSTAESVLSMNRLLGVGFGDVIVTKNERTVYSESRNVLEMDIPSALRYEHLARTDPDNDWRVEFIGPMHGETYQRHGNENWVCIESNPGFA